ncbi:MAG: EF-hand domain-containing protein [Akkermansiaceae bacterium]
MKLKYILITGALFGGNALADDEGRSFGDGTLPEFLQQYDVNEDGVIDEEERQAIREARRAAREERRAAIDTDGDGEISAEEREAAREDIRERMAERRAEKFAEIAGDDGLLSLEEFAAIPGIARLPEERVAALFGRLDADESGDVSLEEFNGRLRRSRPPHRPRPGNGRPHPGGHNRPGPPRPGGGGNSPGGDDNDGDDNDGDDNDGGNSPRPPRPGGGGNSLGRPGGQ